MVIVPQLTSVCKTFQCFSTTLFFRSFPVYFVKTFEIPDFFRRKPEVCRKNGKRFLSWQQKVGMVYIKVSTGENSAAHLTSAPSRAIIHRSKAVRKRSIPFLRLAESGRFGASTRREREKVASKLWPEIAVGHSGPAVTGIECGRPASEFRWYHGLIYQFALSQTGSGRFCFWRSKLCQRCAPVPNTASSG